MARVTKRLTIKISPHAEGKFAVTVTDSETRSVEGKRKLTGEIAADVWEASSVPEALRMIWAQFERECASEDPGDLFAEKKSAKPKLDQ